jgi:glycosyltransferase involved in cell wall biosynthesis
MTTVRASRRRLAVARERRRAARTEVCVLGSGKAFLSGITYHSYGLATALSEHRPTSVILLRNLVPRQLYPGAERVGADLSHLRLPPVVRRAERVDWWWGPGMVEAAWMLIRRPPAVLVVQWWSAAVWHTQLALVLIAKAMGTRVVLEIHETIDTAEQRHRAAGLWRATLAPALVRSADHVIVHSVADQRLVAQELGVPARRTTIITEPPFDHYHLDEPSVSAPEGTVRLLFFGTIRPYKGLEDLIDAFELLCEQRPEIDWQLTVVGETWEGWSVPAAKIRRSSHRDRITFVNRYVTDEEVDRAFLEADLVVLPYHRSSTSGPLQVAMSYGLPVVVTAVGGLPEAVDGYSGAVLVEPASTDDLVSGIEKAERLVGQHHLASRTWADVADEHEQLLLGTLGVGATR